MEILVRNGVVFDPLNGINGEKMDIAVKDGKIADGVGAGAKVIDASGMLVMPGGVDIHSHIAGSKVNMGRIMRPEDHYRDPVPKDGSFRSGVGHTIPSVFTTGYRYSKMGYTTVFEPATPPLKTRHTHDELNDIPMLDKACFPVFGNNWMVMEYLARGAVEEAAAYVGWVLSSVKGYAIKIVNPGGVEAWGWGGNLGGLDEQVPNFNVTPREIVRGLCEVNKMLNLPHPIHVHPNNLGKPGNYETTIKTMDCVKDLAVGDRPIIHMTHTQFESYGGHDWLGLSSGAAEIASYVNRHDHVSLDMGQIIFTDATTMTADGPFQFQLANMTGNKWTNVDVEAETGAGIVPFTYKRSNYVNAVQWAIGLELALLVDNPWKIYMTTDHPNGGPFTSYPKVISWLMSKEARERVLKKIPRMARRRINLPTVDRELTFEEIAIMTRAGTARSLGLKQKGHLGVGADADIAVFPLNPKTTDPSRDYKAVIKAFRNAQYTLKDGEILVSEGRLAASTLGRTFWVKPDMPKDLEDSVIAQLRKKFDNYYTVQMDNYVIEESYLARSAPIPVEGM